MKVYCQPHTPSALPPWKEILYPWIGGWMGPRTVLDISENTLLPCPGDQRYTSRKPLQAGIPTSKKQRKYCMG
jgi:hypothetical protein